jgi:isopenicillin N synthase-like dioxygenase
MRPPLLDLRVWRADPERFARSLRHACHRVGFFQLRHDLPPAVPALMLQRARDFFDLPAADKESICYSRSPAFRGYMAQGAENTAGAADLREQVELAPDEPPAPPRALPPHERLRGPNQWPAAMPALRPAVEEYVHRMVALCDELSEALCLALRLPQGALRPLLHPSPHWQLKLARYIPVARNSAAGGVAATAGDELPLGVGAHTDSGFLTLVLQDGGGGLQAWSRGAWVDVPPGGPDTLVCNLGEVAQLISDGYFLATPHRVIRPRTDRYSVPFFHNPRLGAEVLPMRMPAELEWEREAEYERGGRLCWVRATARANCVLCFWSPLGPTLRPLPPASCPCTSINVSPFTPRAQPTPRHALPNPTPRTTASTLCQLCANTMLLQQYK